MPEYVIVALIEPIAEEFDRGSWPLHLTVLTNFSFEGGADDVLAIISPVADLSGPIAIAPGLPDWFGPDRDIRVVRAEPVDPLTTLHGALLAPIVRAGGRMLVPYWGEQFVPHVTNTALGEFDGPAILEQIALVEILPVALGNRCRVLAELPLARR